MYRFFFKKQTQKAKVFQEINVESIIKVDITLINITG